MKIKFIPYLVFVAILSIGLQGCGQKKAEKQPEVVRPVKTIVVAGNEAFNRSYPGTVRGAQSVNISFRVSGGEVFGIAGVAGNGQKELALALSGERRAKHAKAIRIDGREAGRLNAGQRRNLA